MSNIRNIAHRIIDSIIAVVIAAPVAQPCTSLIATKGATDENSTMITYAADSHNLYGELYRRPAADHPDGAMREIREWDTNKHLGYIPQVRHTYSTVGNINEHGVAIAESTWGGRPELADSTGIVDYGSLIYIALERSKTAREAINVMTDLVREYGYASSGESFSIADPNEVWIMELIGKGPGEKGAVWVAMKVPDGYISGHANHARIHQFPLNDPDNCIYAPDVISFARKKGYFNGADSDFSFSRAYAVYDMGALRGCDARVWAFYNKFNPDMAQYLPWITKGEGPVLPLWVKPNKKLSANDMKLMMRDHFEDTPLNMTSDIGAGPWDLPYRFRPMNFKVGDKEYFNERAIATQQTGFSFVADLNAHRNPATRGLLWFGTDDANTCVYLPIFCSITSVPPQLAHGDVNTLDWNSNFWVNNYVANQAYGRYSLMIPDIRRVQQQLEQQIADDVAKAIADKSDAAATQALADKWAAKATADYKQLGDFLFVRFMDGNRKKVDSNNNFLFSPDGVAEYPEFPGYNQRYYKSIVDDTDDRLELKPIK